MNNELDSITSEMNEMKLTGSVGSGDESLGISMENLNLNTNKHQKRDKCYNLMYTYFNDTLKKKHPQFNFINTDKIARNIEKSCYNYAVEKTKLNMEKPSWTNPNFDAEYSMCVRRVKANITYTPNAPFVLECIKNKTFKPRELVYKSHRELNPVGWERFDMEVVKMMNREFNMESVDPDTLPDGMFTCGRCKSCKTSFTQSQTRSSDEPMTCFIECHNCGHRWRR